jgi:hypothetical protein
MWKHKNHLIPATYQLTALSVLKQCYRMAGHGETGKKEKKIEEYNQISDAWPGRGTRGKKRV